MIKSGKIPAPIRLEQVTYAMAEPAPKMQVLIWLITFGKMGKLFVRKNRDFNRWHPEMDPRMNCRCVTRPLKGELYGR